MKSAAALIFLACLFFVDVKGQGRGPKGRCKCQEEGVGFIQRLRIEKFEVYPSSHSCPNNEIVVTLKNGAGQKCLNPESKFAKNLIRAIKKRSLQ